MQELVELLRSLESPSYRSIVSADTILETENNYPLEDKIAPRLHNEGETNIIVLNTRVEPGAQFNFSANGFLPMRGTINIYIEQKEGKTGKAVIVYNTIKKEC